jgi:hypothetical protein
MTDLLIWDAIAVGLARYGRRRLPAPRAGTAAIRYTAAGTWLVGLFGGDATGVRRIRPALRDLLNDLDLHELGYGEDCNSGWWGLIAGPGRGQPRSFRRDERQAVRLAGILGLALIALTDSGRRRGPAGRVR